MVAATINGAGTFPEASRSVVAVVTVMFIRVNPLFWIRITAATAMSPAATAGQIRRNCQTPEVKAKYTSTAIPKRMR